jgi:hypothetical protein
VPHGFWLANLAVVWAAFFTAWAMFLLPVAIALVAAAALTPVA